MLVKFPNYNIRIWWKYNNEEERTACTVRVESLENKFDPVEERVEIKRYFKDPIWTKLEKRKETMTRALNTLSANHPQLLNKIRRRVIWEQYRSTLKH